MRYSAEDRAYIDGHRFMYGELGEHVATAAILFRDRLMRPGVVLPLIRLAPVAPYGKCMALSGNSSCLSYVDDLSPGVWLYLHGKFYDRGRFHEEVDETVLHELLHNELRQFGERTKHDGGPWARRCQELSTALDVQVRIERVRSVRPPREPGATRKSNPTKACPPGCLPYDELASWPARLFADGPPLRRRAEAVSGPVGLVCVWVHESALSESASHFRRLP